MKIVLFFLALISLLNAQNFDDKFKDKKALKIGKNIYLKECKDIDFKQNLDKQIDAKCAKLSTQERDFLTTYLKSQNELINQDKIEVPKKAKCPVCGMFVAKYPKWAAQTVMQDGHSFYFDGAKDMFKFYFNPKKFINKDPKISQIYVTDYYTQSKIEAKSAFYVIGSDVYGPMGNELIPFAKMSDAKIFAKDHYGKEVKEFSQITEAGVYKLDE